MPFQKGHKINVGKKHPGVGGVKKGYKQTKEHATKTGFKKGHKINTGRKTPNRKSPPQFTKEHINNTSEAVCKRHNNGEKIGFQKGETSWNKDLKGYRAGDKNNFWIDGRTALNNPYPDDWTDTLKESIRQRDNYICQECGTHQDELKGWNKKLDIHHIDYDKKNCNPDNLIALCRKCHIKTNFNREYWFNYFKIKL